MVSATGSTILLKSAKDETFFFFNIMALSIITVDEIMQLNIFIENTIKMEFEETIS